MNRILAVVLTGAFATIGAAAEPRTEHTFQLAKGEKRPAATIEDAGWLAGSWTGTAFGQRFEEVWNPPSAGTMVGCFKLFGDEGVEFYELLLLSVEEGSLSLKVKHFTPEFTAWEEKADYVHFRLVGVGSGVVHFSGLSFYQVSDDEMHAYIAMHNQDKVWEEKLVYRRNK